MKILVTGGDERQIYLAEALEKAGFEVTFVNYLEQMAKEKIESYQVLVLQIAVSKEAISYCSDVMRKGQKIYGGLFPDKFVRLCEEKGVTLFDYMKENTIARKTKQPLEYPNFGSVFKRPEGYFVGKLVQDAGLRGYTIGGVQVSTKHTGFIVNIDKEKAVELGLYNVIGKEIDDEYISEIKNLTLCFIYTHLLILPCFQGRFSFIRNA